MTPAASNRQPTSAIITALIAAVTAVPMPAQFLNNGPAAPAFDRVDYFDSEKLAEAFQFLLVTEQRVCVVVPLDEKFESIVRQPTLIVKRTLPVLLLISDSVIGDTARKIALLGDGQTTPGASGLCELALPAVTGAILANPAGVLSVPTGSTIMTISDKDQARLPGRVCICLEIECTGGILQASVGPGAIL